VKPALRQYFARFAKAEAFSPKYFLSRAAVLAGLFLVVHLAGLRHFTSILNGTVGSVELGRTLSALFGVGYIFAYLGVVLVAPILALAAGLVFIAEKLQPRRPN
jgi:hypothetical protein